VPFAEVKLDRVFVSNCGQDALKNVVCQTVIDLAHRFGALVCAEGVEIPEDAQALGDRGCDIAQGYFFAKPMPADMLLNNVLLLASPFGEQVRRMQSRAKRAEAMTS
jgi:EAL domain-containing protein (putative c-di-GMP-specific phosphodiesterase class I)